MIDDDLARVNIIIVGSVQGVFFRSSTLEKAQSLNLTGWVQNLGDGSVEVVAEGPRYALEELAAWCQHGPPAAKVEDVIVRWAEHQSEFRTFKVVR